MAEYIDRTLLELDTEWSDYYDGFTSYSQSQIQDMPKANVIERSKVDKAIKEIEKESYSESVYGDFYEETTKVVSVEDVLEVFKRNIGE